MSGIWILLAALISFAVTALLGRWMVPFLHKINFGQTIREVGPKWHQKKNGTPTMGGFMFIIGIFLACAICIPMMYILAPENSNELILRNQTLTKAVGGLLMALGFGAIGFLDDYIKVVKKRNLGLNEKQKLILQFLVTAAYLAALYLSGVRGITKIPFLGAVDLGIFFWILSFLGIVGIVNAVNFTDGLDGLNASVTFWVAVSFMLISGWWKIYNISLLAAAVAGGCVGFLIWNFNPAKVFMGDTGSLFLGGVVCALAFGIDMPILLITVGIIYIIEILSVVLQVSYFKLTHGKRLFKMAPIHHHFEMCGWSEVKVCGVFSLVTILFGAASFLLVIFGF
ncbi:MAG: phospho-N-acetylmuramoyl-pentapeptide-transferase [Hydrogeniiclostridium sp.]